MWSLRQETLTLKTLKTAFTSLLNDRVLLFISSKDGLQELARFYLRKLCGSYCYSLMNIHLYMNCVYSDMQINQRQLFAPGGLTYAKIHVFFLVERDVESFPAWGQGIRESRGSSQG